MKFTRSISCTAAVLFAVTSASAALAQDTAWYGALNAGATSTSLDSGGLRTALQRAGFGTTAVNSDDSDTGWKLAAGYALSPAFAIEGKYVDLGEFDAVAALLPTGIQRAEASLRGIGIDLVGSLPLSERFTAFGRLGISNLRIKQRFSNPAAGPAFANNSDRGMHENYGVGLQYSMNDNFALRAELERYRIDENRVTDDHTDMLSLGVVYRFGRRAAPPPPQPAAAPAPAPTPQAAPQPMRITLQAEALFDFDRAELRPAGRAELDDLVGDLAGLDYELVLITGHTDRIGTREYNLALSERRANAVRDYLVGAGVPAARITARGVNSDQPVTTPQQCQGPVSDALKACLQPDRRVEVEVSGVRDAE